MYPLAGCLPDVVVTELFTRNDNRHGSGSSTCSEAEQVSLKTNSFKQEGTTILLVEQNARLALLFSGRGYVLENGSVVLEGNSSDLLADPAVKRAYLGG